MTVPFLPVRNDFHPKRNQARQKLATLPKNRFKDLASDVFHELRRRYPDFEEESVSAIRAINDKHDELIRRKKDVATTNRPLRLDPPRDRPIPNRNRIRANLEIGNVKQIDRISDLRL